MDNARFDRTASEQVLLERARAVVLEHPRPLGRAFTKTELQTIFRKLAPTGYLASTLPKKSGGQDLTPIAFSAIVEGLSPELTLLGNHSVQRYLHQFATGAQQNRFMPDLLEGESIGAIAITETEAGSNLERIKTVARRIGSSYLIDGEKTWVTHGMSANIFVVLASTEAGLTRFLIPGNTPGLEREALQTVGLGHLTFARLTFRSCEVPVELRLGAEGEGLKGSKAAFPIARVLAALQCVQITRAALEIARSYAVSRVVARTNLFESSLIQHGYSQLLGRSEAAYLLCLRVSLQLQSDNAVPNASAAKAIAGDLGLEACRWVEDLLGVSSLHADHPLLRLCGDVRMMGVVDGTSALNHLVVARRLLSAEGSAK